MTEEEKRKLLAQSLKAPRSLKYGVGSQTLANPKKNYFADTLKFGGQIASDFTIGSSLAEAFGYRPNIIKGEGYTPSYSKLLNQTTDLTRQKKYPEAIVKGAETLLTGVGAVGEGIMLGSLLTGPVAPALLAAGLTLKGVSKGGKLILQSKTGKNILANFTGNKTQGFNVQDVELLKNDISPEIKTLEDNINIPTKRINNKQPEINKDVSEKIIVQHNINETALVESDRLGGLPVPSLAISKAKEPMTNFGDVTLLGSSEMAKPKSNNPVYRADAYTTRRPESTIDVNEQAENYVNNNIFNIFKDIPKGDNFSYIVNPSDAKNIAKDIYKGQEGTYSNIALRAKYMYEKGLLNLKNFKTQSDVKKHIRTNFIENEDYYNYIQELRKDMLNKGGSGKEKLFVKYTDNGRKYVPATLENYVKIMKKDKGAGQENLMKGMGNLRAKLTPRFKNITEIKNERNKIVDPLKFEYSKNVVEQNYVDLMGDLSKELPKDIDYRTADELFEDIMLNKLGTHSYSKPYEKHITQEIYDKADNLREELLNLPTEYFEIKPQRAVKLNEFQGAIIPKNSLKSTKNILEKNGIKKIYEYSNEQERKKLFDKFPELMFSVGAVAASSSVIKKQNEDENLF
tara:strand:+ start:29 stop:1909 length:1881 start_codon:yes stop_codon:yes gene_type:complete